jgi:hypothetical protein
MVTFATIFLGLLVGVQSVEVLVTDPVAAVELRLDGERVGTLRSEPWALDCDFGDDLVPHELVALALDAEGREIDLARQWVNLPGPPAEASIFLEDSENGASRVARLSWESLVEAVPTRVVVSFDGLPLEVNDPHRIELPPHDPAELHFLRAELEFSLNVSAVAELSFGGFYADQVNSELSSVPIVLERRVKLPPAKKLQGWFLKGAQPLNVVAVEEGPAEVVVVMDRAAHEPLSRLAWAGLSSVQRGASSVAQARLLSWLKAMMPLKEEQRLRFLWPYSQRQEREAYKLDLFASSEEFSQRDGGVLWLLANAPVPADAGEDQRLADAVAVAAMTASSRNRRRAVVHVLGGETPDQSQLTPTMVRTYLASLRVPLFVWTVEGTGAEEWAEVVDASSLKKLERAVKDLTQSLDRQRIVWLDGVHLPQEISLAPQAAGFSLVER